MSTPASQTAALKQSAAESNNPSMGDKAQAVFADEAEKTFSERVPLWMKIALPVTLAAIVLVSFALGKYSVSPAELAEGIGRHFQGEITTNAELSLDKIIFNIRIPRILLVVFVGAALSRRARLSRACSAIRLCLPTCSERVRAQGWAHALACCLDGALF